MDVGGSGRYSPVDDRDSSNRGIFWKMVYHSWRGGSAKLPCHCRGADCDSVNSGLLREII